MLRWLLFAVKYRVRPSARKVRRWSGNLGSVRRMKENEMGYLHAWKSSCAEEGVSGNGSRLHIFDS